MFWIANAAFEKANSIVLPMGLRLLQTLQLQCIHFLDAHSTSVVVFTGLAGDGLSGTAHAIRLIEYLLT